MSEENKVKISVIVPVYNVEIYLAECLDSILGQTLQDLEIICVNDGSTDGSLEILRRYAEKDIRIRIINQDNAGAGAARNNGAMLAKGKYIGFVDSDDTLFPTMYEELFEKAISTNADMVITGEIETLVGDNIKFPETGSILSDEELSLGTFRAIEYPEILKNVFLWNRIYSANFWKMNCFKIPEKRRFAEDLLPCTQTAVLAKRIAYVKGPLYKYRNAREDSLSATLAKSPKKLDYIIAVAETKTFLESIDQYEFFAREFLTFCISMFILLQRKIDDYSHYQEFFNQMAHLLGEDDVAILKSTWLYTAYPKLITALKAKCNRGVYFNNRLRNLF